MGRIFLFVLLFFISYAGHAQNLTSDGSDTKPGDPIPYGLNAEQWTRAQKIWSRNNYPVMILLSDTTEVIGQMLWTNDSVLVYWADPHSLINPYQAVSLMKTINVDAISGKYLADRYKSLKMYERGVFWGPVAGAVFSLVYGAKSGDFTFFIIPVGIGTICGSLWDMIMGLLVNPGSDQLAFVNYRSLPENAERKYYFLPGNSELIDNNATSTKLMIPDLDKISFSDLMKRSPQVKRAFVTPKFNFKFLLTLSQNLDIYNFGLGFSAGYVLFNKCGIGYSYRFNRAEIPRNAEGNGIYERQEKSSNHIYLNYYPGPLNWLLTTPGFKAFMGADVSLNKVYYFRSISSIGPDYNVNKYLPGFSITAGFDIYPLRNQSIGISAVQSFIKPMQIDELDGFKVRTSGFGIFFSMGFHF